jgi:hypothetical protein
MPVTTVIVAGIFVQAVGVLFLLIEFLRPLAPPPEERQRDPFLSIRAPRYDPFLRPPRQLWPESAVGRTMREIVEWAEALTKREDEVARWIEDLAGWVDKLDFWAHEASQQLLDLFAKTTRRRVWGIAGSLVLILGLGIEIVGNLLGP